jgi:glycosyltransferase involved in cell wall biosynthesis
MRTTIAVYSLFRDSEPHLARTLAQFEDLESLNYDFEYYFYENDSKDNTVDILEEWLKSRSNKFVHENLNAEKFNGGKSVARMELLCECRNKCKNLLKDSKSKYTVLIDSDIIFDKSNLEQHIKAIETLEDCVLITPNVRQDIPDFHTEKSQDSYYDVYPLFDMNGKTGLYAADCPFKNGIDRMKWSLNLPVKCLSAFGGFALSYTDIIKQVKWSTDGKCDHVNFCKELNNYGVVYIDPTNKVRVDSQLSRVNLKEMKMHAKNQL